MNLGWRTVTHVNSRAGMVTCRGIRTISADAYNLSEVRNVL